MRLSRRRLNTIIAEELDRARRIERQKSRRQRPARRARRMNESGQRVVNATPELINRIIREEIEKLRKQNMLSESRLRRRPLSATQRRRNYGRR